MLTFTANTEFSSDGKGTVVRVQSKRTWYLVVVMEEEVLIRAPGLEVPFGRAEFYSDFPPEAVALIYVIHWESITDGRG